MTISTYGELKSSVARWLNRTDLTTVIPDLVSLAEAAIRRDVRCRAMELVRSGSLSGETLAQSVGHLESKRLVVAGVPLSFVTPEVYDRLKEANSYQAVFTNIGTDIYILGGSTNDAYTLVYYKAFDAFSDDADTNWLLTNAPDIYLWASVLEGESYLGNDNAVMKYAGRYQVAVAKMREREIESAFSGSPLAVRSVGYEQTRKGGGAGTSDGITTEDGDFIVQE